jgi:hypothetical protein
MKIKRKAIIILMLACLVLSGCSYHSKEETQEQQYLMIKSITYASTFQMVNNKIDKKSYNKLYEVLDEDIFTYKDVVFLDRAPLEKEFADDVLVFYPSEETYERLDELTEVAINKKIDLSEFGLSTPLTIDDVLNSPVKMRNLYRQLDLFDGIY